MVKADAIQNHLFRMYAQHREFIKISLSKVEWIAFTSDAWTSPNVKFFMALTAHWIDTDWKCKNYCWGFLLCWVSAFSPLHGYCGI